MSWTTLLQTFKLRGRDLLPIVQGGMGVGISAHRLAGTVASCNAFGTISAVDLRRHHPDLMQATAKSRCAAEIDRANLTALDREIRAAGLLGRDGVVLGRHNRDYLRHNGPEHVLCFAPTRSGKGVGLVVPGAGELIADAAWAAVKG